MNRKHLKPLIGIALCFVFSSVVSAGEVVKSSHMVRMSDGTKLSTDVFRPAGENKPLPAIFVRGAYGKLKAKTAQGFCDHGYVLITQNSRGRHDSKGPDIVAFQDDGWGKHRDGHDSVRWIAGQKWCNGKVAGWGASALGITQNLMAPGAPDALKAQFVAVAYSNMYTQSAYQGGVWRKALVEAWLGNNRFGPKSLRSYRAHPKNDAFWQAMNAEAQAHRVNTPAIFYGGWYDIFLQGTLNSFTTIHNQGGEGARGKCRLIIGPWAHGPFDGLKYPANANRKPEAADAFRFFDYWLKGTETGVADDKPVHYYVMGDPEDKAAPGNFWRSVDNWPPPSNPANYYLHSGGVLSTELPASSRAKKTFRYNPKKPVPTVGGQNLVLAKGPLDQREVEAREDVLVFTTDVLDEPVEVTGRIKAKLYVSSNCRDTDFTVKLCDVYPDGRSMLLTDGIIRARYRKGFDRFAFLKKGEVYELTVDLWSTSLVFNKGHRIRVSVSSSNAPRFEPNSNTGKTIFKGRKSRIASNTVHLSRTFPSVIVLPIYDGPADSGK